jgi:Ca-activated chloride channel family protein
MPLAILVSDGHANEGDHSMEGLRARAARAVAGEYVLSAVGVGSGFDEALMSALADAGTGNFYYVRDGSDLGDVFAGEFLSARDTVASSLSVEIDLGDGVELLDAAGYPVERSGRTARFRPGTLFAGQERRVWLSLRAPTDALRDVDAAELRLTWRDPNASPEEPPRVLRIAEPLRVACVADERVFAASLDGDLVRRGLAGDKLAALKQDVASSLRLGRQDEARQRIQAFRLESRADYGRLGLAPEEQGSFREAEALELDVKDAFASPASPAARNALSKTLSSEGQDGRRPGAKRQN